MAIDIRTIPYKNWYDVPEDVVGTPLESPFLGVTGAGKTFDFESIEKQAKTEFYEIIVANGNDPAC